MTSFIYKTINSNKSVAERLKEKRQDLGLTIERLSAALSIPTKYLLALEAGEYDRLPGEVYAKLWIKKYCQALKLDTTSTLKDFYKESHLQLNFSDFHHKKFKKKRLLFSLTPETFRNILVGAAILIFLVYLGWEVKNFIEPPYLQIIEPENNSITTESKTTIIGKTEPEVSLWINNQSVLADPEGNFTQEVELTNGLNSFEISAKKKRSQTNVINLSIIKNNDNLPEG